MPIDGILAATSEGIDGTYLKLNCSVLAKSCLMESSGTKRFSFITKVAMPNFRLQAFAAPRIFPQSKEGHN
jgi:hypothetical protein